MNNMEIGMEMNMDRISRLQPQIPNWALAEGMKRSHSLKELWGFTGKKNR
jgi:hypothetical protein